MNGIAFGFPWRYRPMTDELIVMTGSQVYKPRVYENLGRPDRDQIRSWPRSSCWPICPNSNRRNANRSTDLHRRRVETPLFADYVSVVGLVPPTTSAWIRS